MLTRLALRDFAVASRSTLEPGTGLTVVSGETGAGKSLLVDALQLLSGQRADSGLVRHGSERAELEAEFALDDAPAAAAWLREQALDEDDACQLRRVLRADGGSKAWINGRSVTVAQLAELTGLLVEVHGQHDARQLLERSYQRDLLDTWGNHTDAVAAVRRTALDWQQAQRAIEALHAAGDSADRRDFLQHQWQELERETLTPEAIATALTDHRRRAHGTALAEACAAAHGVLESDDAAVGSLLRAAQARLTKVVEVEPRLGNVLALLDSAATQVDEAVGELQTIEDSLDLDPDALQLAEARLQRLHDLARKHRVPVESLAEVHARLAEQIAALDDVEGRLATLEQTRSAAASAWQTAAASLSALRQASAAALGAQISGLMHELGMDGGQCVIALQANDSATPDSHGAERVEFLVSANPGQPPRPLRKVASGGELSRISLALQVASIGADPVPTMVFDEVDAGIGGATAAVVGRLLRALGERRQVLCVTHLPQVAAQGHTHYHVSKAVADGQTESRTQRLDAAARVEELARMLGGTDITKEARAAARKLLQT